MKLVVGLGNPGREYEHTRHNVGWWVVDHLADVWHFDGWRKDGHALISDGRVGATRVRLLKPQTFMNLSGQAIAPYLRREHWSVSNDLLVIVDEVALPLGRIRFRARGSAGGHNGLKSIEAHTRTGEYARLRVGIRPVETERVVGDLADFVLGRAGRGERGAIDELMPHMTTVIERWIAEGPDAAARVQPPRPPADE